MDRSSQLDVAIDAMSRGDRLTAFDPEIRALLRLAAVVAEDPEQLSRARREAIRRDVFRRLEPRTALTVPEALAAAPRLSPLRASIAVLARSVIAGALMLGVAATATLASVEALPEDPLYPWKLATEQARLEQAQRPADRFAVQVSMAEHRLAEVFQLAAQARHLEAEAAASAFGAHLASAALATQQLQTAVGATLLETLRARVVEQHERLAATATTSAQSPALEALREVTTRVGAGELVAAERIAAAGAMAAEKAAARAATHAVTNTRVADQQLRAYQAAYVARDAAQRAQHAALMLARRPSS